jgi:hypothetical protein
MYNVPCNGAGSDFAPCGYYRSNLELHWLLGHDKARVETIYFRKDSRNKEPVAAPADEGGAQKTARARKATA